MGTSFSVWLGVFVCLIVVRSGAEVENGSAREEGVIGHGEHVVRGVVGREGLNGRSEVALHGSGRKIWRAPIRADGAFVLFDIPDGKYSLRVVLDMENGYVMEASEVDAAGTVTKQKHPESLFIAPRLPLPFFTERGSFNLMAMAKSKYGIGVIVAIVGVILFPRFVDSIDDDLLEELTGTRRPKTESPNETFRKLMGTTHDN